MVSLNITSKNTQTKAMQIMQTGKDPRLCHWNESIYRLTWLGVIVGGSKQECHKLKWGELIKCVRRSQDVERWRRQMLDRYLKYDFQELRHLRIVYNSLTRHLNKDSHGKDQELLRLVLRLGRCHSYFCGRAVHLCWRCPVLSPASLTALKYACFIFSSVFCALHLKRSYESSYYLFGCEKQIRLWCAFSKLIPQPIWKIKSETTVDVAWRLEKHKWNQNRWLQSLDWLGQYGEKMGLKYESGVRATQMMILSPVPPQHCQALQPAL